MIAAVFAAGMAAYDLESRIIELLRGSPKIVADLAAGLRLDVPDVEAVLRLMKVRGRVRTSLRGHPPIVHWEAT